MHELFFMKLESNANLKTGLFFGKWHEEFGKYLSQHWHVSKLEVRWHYFIQSRKYMSLKFTGEGVMCHNNEKWCNIWRGVELSAQNWHEEFGNFWPKTWIISQKFAL